MRYELFSRTAVRYVFTAGPAHASRAVFSVPSRRLNGLVDLMLKD